MIDKVYGLMEDDWPFEYLVTALQILSLNSKMLNTYIPNVIDDMAYDHAGFFVSNSPLFLTLTMLKDCISPGRTWNEWIENKTLESKQTERELEKLYSMLVELRRELNIDLETKVREKMAYGENDEWIDKLIACRELAISILKRISLYQENEIPFKSWGEMYEDLR